MAVALKQEFMAENDSTLLKFLEWFEDLGLIDFSAEWLCLASVSGLVAEAPSEYDIAE